MLLEVIATTAEDAWLAEQGGADRIELITAFPEGGLTPSLGLIEEVRTRVSLPVRVMIRPHARSFVYSRLDAETMLRDVRHVAAIPGLGLVTGMLRADGTVDEELLTELLAAAEGCPVTFHRAFDEAGDLAAAYTVLAKYPQVTDLLTSGGANTAAPQGMASIAGLIHRSAGGGPVVLCGSGLNIDNLPDFLARTGAKRIHLGSAVREGGDPRRPVDPAKVEEVRSLLHSWKR
ncbi:copper homeostasis protein CutC [Paenibacillus sanguinis]|uniref:copper homeostasis protein CutC n=1 Tax=Paenibacillus sanguinis TaxID=225906 RepID=UPI00037541BC|nr:copper homeostasis protein CutC [Paenibacillus sanguinis]